MSVCRDGDSERVYWEGAACLGPPDLCQAHEAQGSHGQCQGKTWQCQCCGAEPVFLGSGYFLFRLLLQVKNIGSSSTHKSLAPTGYGSKNRCWYKTFENLNFNIKAVLNLDFVPKTGKNNLLSTGIPVQLKMNIFKLFSFSLAKKKKLEPTQKYRLRL